jgi:hypothetical protein
MQYKSILKICLKNMVSALQILRIQHLSHQSHEFLCFLGFPKYLIDLLMNNLKVLPKLICPTIQQYYLEIIK